MLPSAQLDPAKLTERLLEVAKELGATVRMGRAAGLLGTEDRVTGIELEDGMVWADATVIAMGPWVHRAAAWLDFPIPVRPLKGQIFTCSCSASRLRVGSPTSPVSTR